MTHSGDFAQAVGHTLILLEIVSLSPLAEHPLLETTGLRTIIAFRRLDTTRAEVSIIFLAGILLSVFGAWVRASCYKHLGRHFTFDLTLQRNHQLITDGPYSVVRHPSYTGMFVFSLGSFICLFGPGSLWQDAELWKSPLGLLLGVLYMGYRLYVNVVLFARVAREDAVLRKEFQDEWTKWEQRTRYRLVPYLY